MSATQDEVAENAGSHARSPGRALATYARFVKLEHTLFSLPLIVAGALIGNRALLAAGHPGAFTVGRLALVFVAAAGARTFALAVNRIIDRRLDAENPRTAQRELPSGQMSLAEAWGVALAGGLLYFGAAAVLSPLCLALSPIPIVVFVGYPYLKRITLLCHFGVGLGLALSPLGGFLGITGSMKGIAEVLPIAIFALFWVAGFDVIYATLDESHDRDRGIRSLPASVGTPMALRISGALHLLALMSLTLWAGRHSTSAPTWIFLALIGALLVWEQRAAQRVNLAFFHINSWLGFVVLALVWAGLS
jgi:4-hydroxybenzoate polyprenyltransferase